MRPDKPGCYWWKDICGDYHVAEFDECMETIDVITYDCLEYVKPEEFERSPHFMRWVGHVDPPKVK